MSQLGQVFLESAIKRLSTYKTLGDRTFSQLGEEDFQFAPAPGSNSIAVIIQHLSGNMISRWTNFLTEDGEKEWRSRDSEFNPMRHNKAELLALWEKGWGCLLGTLHSLGEEDLLKTIYIRHEPLPAIDAINRQIAHYPYHVGQIVYLGKMIRKEAWINLSIPPGGSEAVNRQMQEIHKGQ